MHKPALGCFAPPSRPRAHPGRRPQCRRRPPQCRTKPPRLHQRLATGCPPDSPVLTPLKDPAVAAASPSRLLDSPGEVTITLAGLGWIFRSDLSTPGLLAIPGTSPKRRFHGFQVSFYRVRGLESGFRAPGSRQRAAANRKPGRYMSGTQGGTSVTENGPIPAKSGNPISGNLPQDPDGRYSGRFGRRDPGGHRSGAMEFWEKDAADPGESAGVWPERPSLKRPPDQVRLVL